MVEKAGEGTDTVKAWANSYTLADNVENLIGMKSTGMALTGNGLANIIKGGAGNDTITGAGGADQLWGGAGHDSFVFKSLSDKGDFVMDFKTAEDSLNLRPLLSADGDPDIEVVAKGSERRRRLGPPRRQGGRTGHADGCQFVGHRGDAAGQGRVAADLKLLI